MHSVESRCQTRRVSTGQVSGPRSPTMPTTAMLRLLRPKEQASKPFVPPLHTGENEAQIHCRAHHQRSHCCTKLVSVAHHSQFELQKQGFKLVLFSFARTSCRTCQRQRRTQHLLTLLTVAALGRQPFEPSHFRCQPLYSHGRSATHLFGALWRWTPDFGSCPRCSFANRGGGPQLVLIPGGAASSCWHRQRAGLSLAR